MSVVVTKINRPSDALLAGFDGMDVAEVKNDGVRVEAKRSALLRTARKLMQGSVFDPPSIWSRS